MPLLPELEPVTNPFGVPDGAKPPGMIVTRDEHSPPRSDGGRPWADTFGNEGLAKPGFTDTLGASFRLENEIVGAWRKASEADLDFGPEDPTHNPWDYKLKDNPRLRGHAEHFVSSRNAKETDYIASRIERELEDRRIRDVSGVTGFATDMVASLLSPTILLPGGTIYRGYRAGYSTLRSAGSVAAYATLGVGAQEAILQSQQYTRTVMESLLNVGGGTILGGMLGGGVSHFSSRALRKASQAFDTHLDGIRSDRITIDGVRDPNEAPFGSPVGAAPVRELQENRVASAFGLERLFSFQSPLTRVMAGTSRVGRDIMTRLAEMPFMLEQNKRGIATGPAGGAVEARIKQDGDITIYRVQNAIYDNFNAYRFGNKDATLGPLRAGFADVTKPDPGRLSQKRFKEEITRALRSQTKEQGIEHPIPEVKAAAVAIRKEFDTWLERAIDVGILPAEAKYSLNYVMRRWDVGAILDNMARFEQILFQHLKGGQMAALAELAKLEDAIASLRAAGDLGPEVAGLQRQVDDIAKRFAVDQGTVDTVMDMWRFVVKEKPKKPLSLSEMLRKEGGIRDDGRTLEHLLGSKKQAGSLINSKSKMDLDGAGLVAFEKGYFDERPTVRDLLDAIDEDVRSGGTSHFSRADADAVENWRVAGEFKEELERYGIAGVTSEKQARKIVTQMMREESATPAAQAAREGIDADRAFLDDVTKADIPDTPEARAALDDAKLETETRIDDAEQSLKRMGDDGEEPLFAGAAPARMVRRMVETGQTYRLSENDIARQFDAVAEFTPLLPGTTAWAAWSRVGPSPTRGPDFANVTFRTSDGREVTGDWSIDDAFSARAAFVGGNWNVILAGGIGKEHSGLDGAILRSGIYHEIIHAAWRNLAAIDRIRLAAHADKLRVLKMEWPTFFQAIGHPAARRAQPGETIGERYSRMYALRPNKQDLIDQEAVAHMQELHYAGHFSDAEVEAVLPDLLNMRGGAPARGGDLTPTDMPVFAIQADKDAGRVMKRELDALGFYSAALEAARKFQNKGTPEQAMAWLKKNGVKDAEIKATKTAEFLDGKSSVTREELMAHLEKHRVELAEAKSRMGNEEGPAGLVDRNGDLWTHEDLQFADDGLLEEVGISVDDANRFINDAGERDSGDATTFSHYSLNRFDPNNRTYAETRLFIPDPRQARLDELEARYSELTSRGSAYMGSDGLAVDDEIADLGAAADKLRREIERDTVGSHFAERNVVGHMQTTIQTHQGRPVFTVNQIQSDWGQKLRDGGVRDEAKIAELRRERDEAQARVSDFAERGNKTLPRSLQVLHRNNIVTPVGAQVIAQALEEQARRIMENPARRILQAGKAERMQAQANSIRDAVSNLMRLQGELRALSGAVIGHPLVANTDQWVNTTLRRAIRQAVEADADYIAIPTGGTVLTYNPGDIKGMREFYGGRPKATPEQIAAQEAAIQRAEREAFGEEGSLEQRPWNEDAAEEVRIQRELLVQLKRGTGESGIVPKNLRNLLAKIDKEARPEYVDHLGSPVDGGGASGMKLGEGFTIFPLTDKIKMAMRSDDGLPLFAAKAGDEPEAPRIPPELIEQARALAERMGVRVPDDLATLDIDDGLKSLGDMLEAMVGRGEASSKANAADIQKLVDQKGEADFLAHASDGDLRGIVRDTISKLTGSPIARNVTPFDLSFAQQGPRGPAMARTLKIADNLVEDFLDSDIERIMLAYVRTMAPDVAIAREFGDLNLTEDKQRLLTEYQSQVATASPKDARRLHKEHLAAIRDIDDVTRRLRGTFNDGVDPTSFGPRAAMFVKQANILRLMGSVVASSISDPMKLLFTHGFRGNADLFSTLITDFQGLRMSKAEAKEMSAGLEFSHSRTGQMWDTIEEMAGFTAPERAMRYMTNKMGRLNLMDAWNSTLKQFSGAMTTNRILRASLDYTNGRIAVGNKDVTRLAASGIDADLARVIAQQYQKHGTVHGRLFLANVEAWDDTAEATMAKHALQSAVRREADITLVTPGQEKPTWTSRHMGSVIGQFRTFQLVSIQRTLIAGLQEVDAAKIVALTGMIGLGMLSEQLKSVIHGKDPRPKDMGEWLYAGLANSGALGWLTDADQSLHKLSAGNVSVARRVFGNDRPISRFASQNVTGALLGPTFGAAEDIARAASAGLSGKGVTEGDIHAMRRLIPYQNLFYISRSLRAFEEGLIDAWGIPRQRARN
jgi:hypothetical protein